MKYINEKGKEYSFEEAYKMLENKMNRGDILNILVATLTLSFVIALNVQNVNIYERNIEAEKRIDEKIHELDKRILLLENK